MLKKMTIVTFALSIASTAFGQENWTYRTEDYNKLGSVIQTWSHPADCNQKSVDVFLSFQCNKKIGLAATLVVQDCPLLSDQLKQSLKARGGMEGLMQKYPVTAVMDLETDQPSSKRSGIRARSELIGFTDSVIVYFDPRGLFGYLKNATNVSLIVLFLDRSGKLMNDHNEGFEDLPSILDIPEIKVANLNRHILQFEQDCGVSIQ